MPVAKCLIELLDQDITWHEIFQNKKQFFQKIMIKVDSELDIQFEWVQSGLRLIAGQWGWEIFIMPNVNCQSIG